VSLPGMGKNAEGGKDAGVGFAVESYDDGLIELSSRLLERYERKADVFGVRGSMMGEYDGVEQEG